MVKSVMMRVKNPRYNASGTVDLEIEHPTLGWIPFTAAPDDPKQHGRDLHAEAIAEKFGPIAEYVAPQPTAPSVVTMRQARLALANAGLLAGVDAFIANMTDPAQKEAAQIEWGYAQTVRRDHPLLIAFAQFKGMTDAQIDDLFLKAAEL